MSRRTLKRVAGHSVCPKVVLWISKLLKMWPRFEFPILMLEAKKIIANPHTSHTHPLHYFKTVFSKAIPAGQQQMSYYISHKLPHATQATSAGICICRCNFFPTLHTLGKRSHCSAKKSHRSETTSGLEKKILKILRFYYYSDSKLRGINHFSMLFS